MCTTEKFATDFPTEAAWKKYLQQHPKADRSKHTVITKEDKQNADRREKEVAMHDSKYPTRTASLASKVAAQYAESKGIRLAHGPVALKDPDVMLYMIDAGTNKSKFYEMKVLKSGTTWLLQKRNGRLTDSTDTGRADGKDEPYPDQNSAEMAMWKMKKEKMGKGYKEATNKEYPIGLGGAGFGWGSQSAHTMVPELKKLRDSAYVSSNSFKELDTAVDNLAKKQSAMAAKLVPLYKSAVKGVEDLVTYLDGQLAHH